LVHLAKKISFYIVYATKWFVYYWQQNILLSSLSLTSEFSKDLKNVNSLMVIIAHPIKNRQNNAILNFVENKQNGPGVNHFTG
jgi:hypothetical protein